MEIERLETYQRTAEILQEKGYEADVYEGYSGRAMYGKTCTGLVTDAPSGLIGWAIALAATEIHPDEDPDDLQHLVPQRTDNMGLSMIYY